MKIDNDPSARPQIALRWPSGDSLRQSGLGTTFGGKILICIVFFCKGDATEYFRRRVAKATCTEHRACA